MGENSYLTLRDILRTFFKRFRQIFLVTFFSAALGSAVIFLYPPVYESRGEILVKRASFDRNEPSVEDERAAISANIRHLDQSGEMATVIVLLESTDLISLVIDDMNITRESFENIPDYRKHVRGFFLGIKRMLISCNDNLWSFLGLYVPPTPKELAILERKELIADVKEALMISQVPDSDIIRVSFRGNDPVLVRNTVKYVCEMALVWHEEKVGLPSENLPFYLQQVNESKDKLTRINQELADEKKRLHLIGAEKQKDLLVEHRLLSRVRLNKALARKESLSAGIAALKKALEEFEPYMVLNRDVSINPLWENVAHEVARMKLERLKMQKEFSEKGRMIKAMDKSIARSENLLEGVSEMREMSRREGINPVHESLLQNLLLKLTQHSAVIAEVARVREEIREYDRDLVELNRFFHHIAWLELERVSAQKAYDTYLRGAEEARLLNEKKNAKIADLTITQQADHPIRPVKPRKLLYIFLAAMGGFMLSTVWAFAQDLNDTTIWNPDEIKRELGLPVLGTIRKL